MRTVKIISTIFMSLIAVITFYQILIGNPFHNDINPIFTYIVFLIISVLIFLKVRDEK